MQLETDCGPTMIMISSITSQVKAMKAWPMCPTYSGDD